MNNKKLGTAFERFMCEHLARLGYWVHFISPDTRGAQPFDIIAVRDDIPIVMDCKTSSDHIFRFDRLENNQVYAFEKWLATGNLLAYVAVLHNKNVYMIRYVDLKEKGKVDLKNKEVFVNGVLLR